MILRAAKLGGLHFVIFNSMNIQTVAFFAFNFGVLGISGIAQSPPPPAPAGVKHPLGKKIDFTTNQITIDMGGPNGGAPNNKLVWEMQMVTEKGMSFDKILHVHKGKTSTVQLEIPAMARVKVFEVKVNNATNPSSSQVISVESPAFNKKFSSNALIFNDQILFSDPNPDLWENPHAVTVKFEYQKDTPDGHANEEVKTSSFDIPVNRINSLQIAGIKATKKIFDEGQHHLDDGTNSGSTAPEKPLYFPQSPTVRAGISCVGFTLQTIRHGYQFWTAQESLGLRAYIRNTHQGDVLGYMNWLRVNRNWNIYYVTNTTQAMTVINDGYLNLAYRSFKNSVVQYTDCATPGTAGHTGLQNLLAKKYILMSRNTGYHCAIGVDNLAYEAHFDNTGDAIFDRSEAAGVWIMKTQVLLSDRSNYAESLPYGFIAVPPE